MSFEFDKFNVKREELFFKNTPGNDLSGVFLNKIIVKNIK